METRVASKQLTSSQRWLLYFASSLVLIMGLNLYFLAEQTETTFAWTIGVPLTAAFLGAGYLSSFLIEFMAARETLWVKSRIALPTAFTFTILTSITTLIHLDKFHLESTNPITVIVTWAWLLVYAIVPFIMGIVFIQQLRSDGTNPAPTAYLPRWFKVVIGIQGGVMLIIGLGFMFVPMTFAPLWSWTLTPLTARAIGAWLSGIGVATFHSIIENDWGRLRPAMASYALFGILQLINLMRFSDADGLDWSQMKTWLYVIFLISILGIGCFGTWRSQQHYSETT